MDDNLYTDDIWAKASQSIGLEISPMSFDTWIKPLIPITIQNDVFYLEAPSEVCRNMLNMRHMRLLEHTISVAAGRPVQVQIHLPGEMPEVEAAQSSRVLNPKYTFDTFVVGSGNRFAHAAALAVAEMPAEAYNPLFIYGGVGLGKTHLMHAIGRMILDQRPRWNVLYVSSETFTNEVINAIAPTRGGSNVELRNRLQNKFRNVDVLMIDDIQFISGKESTQEEFFHTFNTLHEAGKQIVISADKQPKEMVSMEDRLRSRFEWGLIADIQKPDFETRVSILRRKAELENYDIQDEEVFTYIAERFESNIRELEGNLARVRAFAQLGGTPLTLALAQEALREMVAQKNPKLLPPEVVLSAVSEYFGVSKSDIISQKRNREIVLPRQVAMYILREVVDMSLPTIGAFFGGRDHTTVMHACNKLEREMPVDRRLQTAVNDLKKRVLED